MPKTICDSCGALFPVNELGPIIGVLVKSGSEEKAALCLECFAGGLVEAAKIFRKKEDNKNDIEAQVGPGR